MWYYFPLMSELPKTYAAIGKLARPCECPLMESPTFWRILGILVREAGLRTDMRPADQTVITALTEDRPHLVDLTERQLSMCAAIARYGRDMVCEMRRVLEAKSRDQIRVRGALNYSANSRIEKFCLSTHDKISTHFSQHPLPSPFDVAENTSLLRSGGLNAHLLEQCPQVIPQEYLELANRILTNARFRHPTLDSNADFPPAGWKFRSQSPLEQFQILKFMCSTQASCARPSTDDDVRIIAWLLSLVLEENTSTEFSSATRDTGAEMASSSTA